MSRDELETAVEIVVRWLADHGHEDLAMAIAGVTDPSPRTRARWARGAAKRLAAQLGARGGAATGEAKAAAARANGARGGRPRKAPSP